MLHWNFRIIVELTSTYTTFPLSSRVKMMMDRFLFSTSSTAQRGPEKTKLLCPNINGSTNLDTFIQCIHHTCTNFYLRFLKVGQRLINQQIIVSVSSGFIQTKKNRNNFTTLNAIQTEGQPCVMPPPMLVWCNQTAVLCRTRYNHLIAPFPQLIWQNATAPALLWT